MSAGLRVARRRAIALAVVALAAAAAAVAYLVLTRPPAGVRPRSQPALPRPAQPVPGIGVLRPTAESWRAASGYHAYAYLIVGLALARRAAREPGRSLVYVSGTDVNRNWDTGVPYAQAARHGWLLRDRSGRLLVNRSYPTNAVGDVGNPAYQRAWLGNVLRLLRRNGDSGVFIDDTIADLAPLAGTEAAKYPTQGAWASAQLSFVRAVGPALRARGYYVLVNASAYVPGNPASNDGTTTVAWWRQLAPYVSGLADEHYQETSDGRDTLRTDGPAWDEGWSGWQRLVATAQSLGRDFVGIAYGPAGDPGRMSYGRASFLLDWNGRGGAFVYQPTSQTSDPWNGAWTLDVGRPLAAKQRVGVAWLRRYSRGVALVDPDPARAQRVDLGGRYLAPGGGVVSEVTLPPATGLVLPRARLGG